MRGFHRRLLERYSIGFDLFAMLLTLSHELGEEINQAARQRWPTGPQSRLATVREPDNPSFRFKKWRDIRKRPAGCLVAAGCNSR